MPTTTNFGWTTPADTDLVSQGAAAMRTLAGGIDTSLVDLKGGTTGQILTKATNTDLDYSWVDPASGWQQLATGTLSGTTVSITGIPQTYKDLRLVIFGANMSVAGLIRLRFGGASIDTGTNYRANYTAIGTAAWTAGAATTYITGAATATQWNAQIFEVAQYAQSTWPGKQVWAMQTPNATYNSEILLGTWNGNQIEKINILSSQTMLSGNFYLYGRV